MLISPPFLPRRNDQESDEDYVRRAMTGDAPGVGAFPVSFQNRWHGGLHLSAPFEHHEDLDVRAIADGVLAYRASISRKSDEANHPLNYAGGWTSDGCVILKHCTEIGEGEDGKVEFYSIYHHLRHMPPEILSLPIGHKVWRKDVVGSAGYINEKPNLFHFEIIADDVNARRLMGRIAGDVPLGSDGRRQVCYGDMHFYLPPSTTFSDLPTHPHGVRPMPRPVAGPGTALFVAMHFDKGHCTMSTYREDGTLVGTVIDDEAPGASYEYQMYETATKHYPQQPAAGFELLRFGRVLGTADTLTPADAAHWRKVALPSGNLWVNLNGAGIVKLSDADLPHWLGWRMVDASRDDVRCRDEKTLALLPSNTTLGGIENVAEGAGAAVDASTAALRKRRFARTVVKFLSEWDDTTLEKRQGWLKKPAPEGRGMSVEDFARLERHAQAVSFWTQAKLGMESVPWHFEPREFIIHFKKCGWLSADELPQLLPTTAMRLSNGNWVSEIVPFSDQAEMGLEPRRAELNRVLCKFGIAPSPWRMAAFFGNAAVETQWFGKLYEDNEKAWYHPWDGRGFLQLTGPDNYIKYWRFRGRIVSDALKSELSVTAGKARSVQKNEALQDDKHRDLTAEMIQWRNDVNRDPFDSVHSAGAYWVWSGAAAFGSESPLLMRETKTVGHVTRVYYSCQSFGQVAATVNFGSPVHDTNKITKVNGIVARYQAYTQALMVLADRTAFPDSRGQLQDTPEGYTPRRKK